MKSYYSKIQPQRLISSLIRLSDIKNYRTDICPSSEYIQVSARTFESTTHVKPHIHKPIDRHSKLTQEAWIVISGEIKAEIFDIDKKFLDEIILTSGDCIVLFSGGHSLTSLKENTIFYEIKTGPYYGYENDKEDI